MKSLVDLMFLFSLVISNVLSMPNAAKVGNNKVQPASNDASVIQAPNCLIGFMPLGDKCYLFDTTQISWDDARSICIGYGGNLAHISNSDEERLIVEHLMDVYEENGDFWIGANDIATEGTFVWTDDNSALSYTNWDPLEPNNSNGNEDCVVLRQEANYAWNDATCTNTYGFVCQEY